MKTSSQEEGVSLLSRAIEAMATGKKTTAGYRALHLVAVGILLGNVLDAKGTLAQLSKLPAMIPIIEEHSIELRELRKLREQDHQDIEYIKEVLRRNKLGSNGDLPTDISTAKIEE